MEIKRGEIWWADLGIPAESEPGFKRPVIVIQADVVNKSKISTVICAACTGNLTRADAPGNVLIPSGVAQVKWDSVVNVSQIITLNKSKLSEKIGQLDSAYMARVDAGLKFIQGL